MRIANALLTIALLAVVLVQPAVATTSATLTMSNGPAVITADSGTTIVVAQGVSGASVEFTFSYALSHTGYRFEVSGAGMALDCGGSSVQSCDRARVSSTSPVVGASESIIVSFPTVARTSTITLLALNGAATEVIGEWTVKTQDLAPPPCPPVCGFLPPPPPPVSAPASDPRAATMAVVAEQVAAAGVEGSANAVRVRGTEVLPVTSRLSSAVGPRGGVVLDSDGFEVRVASVLGARADAGVLVPSSGMFEVSVTGPLAPGSVVEAWINSQPRLVAAAEVPAEGDTTTIVIPTGTPLDGGEAIEDGAHTLELRMFTTDGFEIVATGITVGSPVPSGVPAGQGGVPLGADLLVLLGAAGAALVAVRRLVSAG